MTEKRSIRVLRTRCARHEATKPCLMSISLPAAMPEPTRPRRRACHTSCAPSLSARTFSQSTPKRFILPEKAVRGFDAAIAVEYFFPSRALLMTFKHYLHHLSAPESSPSLTCLLSSQAVVWSKEKRRQWRVCTSLVSLFTLPTPILQWP